MLLGSSGDSLREAFGRALVRLGAKTEDFVVFDADIAGGTGTHHFRSAYPERFYQFGIAEQNMMAVAGGFASVGIVPFVTTFAVFCMRGFEQARLSVAYANRNVKIVGSHPGLDVGPDGGSAQALEDLAVFRAIPQMVVVSPADPFEVDQATEAILEYTGPVYMRTGRSPARRVLDDSYRFELGRGSVLRDGSDVTLIACGVEVAAALDAWDVLRKDGVSARVVNMATVKPIDRELVMACAAETGCIVTAEDHNVFGGLGSAVAEVVVQHSPCVMEFVGIRDSFGESGEPAELREKYGLTGPHIAAAALRAIDRKQRR